MVYQLFNLIFSWFALANYYIAFAILSESMEDKSFNLKGIAVVNVILNYFYLGLLMMCFILSLGNRPQGSKWGYTAAMIGFSVVTIYMTVRVVFLFVVRFGADACVFLLMRCRSRRSFLRSRVSRTLPARKDR